MHAFRGVCSNESLPHLADESACMAFCDSKSSKSRVCCCRISTICCRRALSTDSMLVASVAMAAACVIAVLLDLT